LDGPGPACFQAQVAEGAFVLVGLDGLGVFSVLAEDAHRAHVEAFTAFFQTQATLPVYFQIHKKTHVVQPLQFEVEKISGPVPS
jgi:hypothetical protein